MKRVRRDEILDWVTYEDVRETFRARVLAAKAPRRVQLGPHLTLLFENPLTVRYQIQEMVRIERIVREADIGHEIDTYNELLGGEGELGCTLLVEIDDPSQRQALLQSWWELPEHVYVRLANGTRVRASFDARQRGDGKLSAVQFLKFAVGNRTPVAVGVDLAGLEHETLLEDATRRALADDLAGRDE
jgi:hypothetical protein